MQEAYARMHDSPGTKREHISPMLKLGKMAKNTIDLNGKTCHLVRDPPSTLVRAVCWLACSGHDHGVVSGISEPLVFCLSLVEPRGLWFKEDLTRVKY